MKKYIQPLKNTILTCAIIHLAILGFIAIRQSNLSLINGYNILDLDLLFPELAYGTTNLILSYMLIGTIFLFFVWKNSRK